MDASLDTLLVALLVALAPVEQELPAVPPGDTFAAGVAQGYHGLELRPSVADTSACRSFFDAEARHNCVIRTTRAGTGSAAPDADFPSQVTWIAPGDPGMPFRFAHGGLR